MRICSYMYCSFLNRCICSDGGERKPQLDFHYYAISVAGHCFTDYFMVTPATLTHKQKLFNLFNLKSALYHP